MNDGRESRLAKVQKKHVWSAIGTILAAMLAYPGIEAKIEDADGKLDVAYAVLQKEVDHLNDSNEKLQDKVENQSKILILMYGMLMRMGAPLGGEGVGVGMGFPGMGFGAGFGLGGGGGPPSGAMALSGAPAAPDVDTDSDTDSDSDAEATPKSAKSASKAAKKGSASMIEELLVEVEKEDEEEERPDLPDDIDALVQAKM